MFTTGLADKGDGLAHRSLMVVTRADGLFSTPVIDPATERPMLDANDKIIRTDGAPAPLLIHTVNKDKGNDKGDIDPYGALTASMTAGIVDSQGHSISGIEV